MRHVRSGDGCAPTRRRLLRGIGAAAVSCLMPGMPLFAAEADLTGRLAAYMVASRNNALTERVRFDARQRILDTVAAMVSGSSLPPGVMATRFIRGQGGQPECSVLASDVKTTAVNAALANAMLAHSDESDDFEAVTKAHPGSSVVPAAFAMAEKDHRSGDEMIRAVALGYDVACRFLLALGADQVRGKHRGAEAFGANMGAMAAASSLAGLDETAMRYAISYAGQQVSGLWSWVEDHDHIEKAFDFAGMGCRNGVTAAVFVQSGFTGVHDVLGGRHNLLQALSSSPRPEALLEGLGSRFYVSESGIKTFPVGYPNQAPLDAILKLRRENGLTPDMVRKITVHLPEDAIGIVSNSPMPDVNCQYLMATALVDGAVSFVNAHSRGHMGDGAIRAVMERVTVVGDPKLNDPEAPRGGLVEVALADGRTVSHHTRFAPGTKENPVDTETLNAKARDMMTPVLGAARTEEAIGRFNALEGEPDVHDLIRSVLTV